MFIFVLVKSLRFAKQTLSLGLGSTNRYIHNAVFQMRSKKVAYVIFFYPERFSRLE